MDTISRPSREPKDNKFSQQELKAFRPVLSPTYVIIAYLIVGSIMIPFGSICLEAARGVKEVRVEYSDRPECKPNKTNQDSFMELEERGVECTLVNWRVEADLDPPIYVYYELEDYYQNHRRYVKSRSAEQLAGKTEKGSETCKPKLSLPKNDSQESDEAERVIRPCGLAAWSFFNDTFSITKQDSDGDNIINSKGIAWKTDIDYLFGNYTTQNFNERNHYYSGGGRITGNVSDDEHFVVWMRLAALPKFRKLYGRINTTLTRNDTLNVTIANNYNTYGFDGKKTLILSTSSWIGGKSDFLAVVQITIGCACYILGFVYFLLHINFPRKLGDERFLSWVH